MPRTEYVNKNAEDTYAAGRVSEAAIARRAEEDLKKAHNQRPSIMADIVQSLAGESSRYNNAVAHANRDQKEAKRRAYGGYGY